MRRDASTLGDVVMEAVTGRRRCHCHCRPESLDKLAIVDRRGVVETQVALVDNVMDLVRGPAGV